MRELVVLDTCASTQDEVRIRLAQVPLGTAVAVATEHQAAGRGRGGRSWQNPPGRGLLLSVGLRPALEVPNLSDLPRDVVHLVREITGPDALAWKAPNDLMCAANGAKVGGVLVDVRSTGQQVDEVIIGIGLNVEGSAFSTVDGRAATTVAACVGGTVDYAALRAGCVAALAERLTSRPA